MKTHHKALIGGLGAITPIIINFVAVDSKLHFSSIDGGVVLGYLVRIILLFFLGGIWAALHKKENDPKKLFEIGIIAPALIAGIISANAGKQVTVQSKNYGSNKNTIMLIQSAYAQPPEDENVKTFVPPKANFMKRFYQGLLNAPLNERSWFVIISSHQNLEAAENQAQEINKMSQGFLAEVYGPYEGKPYYSVVIGANLALEEAQKLERKAIDAGLQGTHLWNILE